MWSFRRSRTQLKAESRLRDYRAEPRNEFVRELSGRIEDSAGRRRTAWSRLAFAAAASTFILGVFASVGGFGYVASGASATYSVAKQVVVKHKVAVHVDRSSAASQYSPTNTTPPQNNVAGVSTQQSSGAVAGVSTAKTLPFTGISLLATVLIGSALLALGLVLRRRERRQN